MQSLSCRLRSEGRSGQERAGDSKRHLEICISEPRHAGSDLGEQRKLMANGRLSRFAVTEARPGPSRGHEASQWAVK